MQLISILGGDFSGDKIISLGLRIAPTEKTRSPEHHGCGLCFLLAFLFADKAQYFRFVETKFLRERFNASVTDRFHSLGTGDPCLLSESEVHPALRSLVLVQHLTLM